MRNDIVLVVLKKKEAAELERMLEARSWKLQCARKPGAKPGRKEILINSILEEVEYASAVGP